MLELILEKVRLLTADNPSLSDDLLMIYVEQAYNEALGYCNALELPETAVNTVALMAVSILPQQATGAIQSLSEGSRTVTYDTGTALKPEYKKALDKFKAVRCV